MKVYKLDFDVNNYKSIQLCEEISADYYQMFDGTSLKNRWKKLKVKFYEEDKDLKDGDAPGFNIPVFNEKALNALLPLIKDNVEILPLQLNNETLYGINVLSIVNALNYDLSEYKTFRDGKRVMAIKKYAFIEEKIEKNNIFKLMDLPRGDVFVSEEFHDRVIDYHLEGFKLEIIYDETVSPL